MDYLQHNHMSDTYHFHFNQGPDPVQLSWQMGWQIWYPTLPISVQDIQSYYSIDNLIQWFNEDITQRGVHSWYVNTRYFIPQIIKINLLYHDLKQGPNLKPLLLYQGQNKWDPLTGDTRLRVYELIGVPAEVSSLLVVRSKPDIDCRAILSSVDFAEACDANSGTPFWLRIGKQGLEWYEMAVPVFCEVTGQKFCDAATNAIIDYVTAQGAGFRLDRDWFRQSHNWNL
jgi:hypothetical protein